jgi:hypothetical protein
MIHWVFTMLTDDLIARKRTKVRFSNDPHPLTRL